jgi:hypothetical protein
LNGIAIANFTDLAQKVLGKYDWMVTSTFFTMVIGTPQVQFLS